MSAVARARHEDEATRALAQSEFTSPLVVEAGAGTGKTALLVARVAAWCVGAGWEHHAAEVDEPDAVARRVIEGVVAITFTEAAAAEMAHRIGEALAEIANGGKPVGWSPSTVVREIGDRELAARATALTGEAHRLQVMTIHSYCQRMLAAHPFEAGLHPRFQIDADGAMLETLVDEVLLETLRELDGSPRRGDWEHLAGRGVGPARIAEALRELVSAGARPTDLARDPFGEEAAPRIIGRLVKSLDALIDAEAGRLSGLTRVRVAVRTMDALTAVFEQLEASGSQPGFGDLAAALGRLDADALKRLRTWAKAGFGKAEAGALADDAHRFAGLAGDLLQQVEPLSGIDPEAFGAARRLLLELLTEVERRRSERGIVTFQDLLEKTAELFETQRGICAAEQRGIDQLLVDEFQDTDDVQCRIVRCLALEGPEDRRPGLFIVGDPKQSIYAWRSADLAAYDAFVETVESQGGLRRPLTRNFRSVRPILDEVERVVAPVMHRQRGFQPAFEALEATDERETSPGFDRHPWSAVEHWICWAPDAEGQVTATGQTRPKMTALEALAVATDIRRLHDTAGVRFGDIAVLLRTTTAQGELLEAFRTLDVPFEVAREREYFRQREIIEAAALVRAILEPADALALLTVIRSDAVGVPDAALAPLWDGGLHGAMAGVDGEDPNALEHARRVALTVPTPEGVPGLAELPEWRAALVGALDNLAALRRSFRVDPPDVFVERLRTLWLAEVSAGARHLGRFRQARLDEFLAELEQILVRGAGGGADIARFLRRAVEEGREAPTASEPDREADAVHLMTIYGAKGLDFEQVYLVQTHRGTGSFGRPEAVLRRVEGIAELALFGWPSPGLGAAESRRDLQAHAEAVRLLYVAMTRAKQRLVVSGGWPTPGDRVDPFDVSTLVELVAHRGRPETIDGLIERGLEREAGIEPGVTWVIPALSEAAETTSQAQGPTARLAVDRDEVAADAEAIARARSEAAERMLSRWSSPASDAAHRSRERMEAEAEDESTAAPVRAARGAATAVGTSIHHLLETLDLDRDLPDQIATRRRNVIDKTTAALDAASAAEATSRVEGLLDRLTTGECLGRLAGLASAVAARELGVFARPTGDDGSAVVSGAIDLVYRDSDDGCLVVADYKTDLVEEEADLAERVDRYRPQLEVYARALEEALDLDHRPHTELWFLHPDRIIRLSK